jgi:hypothetical protein
MDRRFLVDYGLALTISTDQPPITWSQMDLAGFASLERRLCELERDAPPVSLSVNLSATFLKVPA